MAAKVVFFFFLTLPKEGEKDNRALENVATAHIFGPNPKEYSSPLSSSMQE